MRSMVFAAVVLVFVLVSATAGDTYVAYYSSYEGLPTGAAAEAMPKDTTEMWIVDNLIVTKAMNMRTIVDHDEGLMTVIDPDMGRYMTMSLPQFAENMNEFTDTLAPVLDSLRRHVREHPEELEQLIGEYEGEPELQDMIRTLGKTIFGESGDSSMITFLVTPVDETRNILGLRAMRYDAVMTVMGVGMQLQMWATEQIELNDQATYTFVQTIEGMYAGLGIDIDAIMREWQKVKGSVIEQRMTLQIGTKEMVVNTHLVAWDTTATCPPELLVIPEGYEQIDMTEQMMQR